MTEFSFGPYHLWADPSYYIAHPCPGWPAAEFRLPWLLEEENDYIYL